MRLKFFRVSSSFGFIHAHPHPHVPETLFWNSFEKGIMNPCSFCWSIHVKKSKIYVYTVYTPRLRKYDICKKMYVCMYVPTVRIYICVCSVATDERATRRTSCTYIQLTVTVDTTVDIGSGQWPVSGKQAPSTILRSIGIRTCVPQ